MERVNRYDGIDDYAVRLIEYKARQLIGTAGLTKSDLKDLEQELMLDLLERLPKHDPKRAQSNTLIACIVNHKAASIIEKRSAAKRDWRMCACSLDDLIGQNDESLERSDMYEADGFLTGRLSRSAEERMGLAIDLDRFTSSLSPELRDLCERLKEENIAEIARTTGIPVSTLHDRLNKIRRLSEKSGLRDYFLSPPSF